MCNQGENSKILKNLFSFYFDSTVHALCTQLLYLSRSLSHSLNPVNPKMFRLFYVGRRLYQYNDLIRF